MSVETKVAGETCGFDRRLVGDSTERVLHSENHGASVGQGRGRETRTMGVFATR